MIFNNIRNYLSGGEPPQDLPPRHPSRRRAPKFNRNARQGRNGVSVAGFHPLGGGSSGAADVYNIFNDLNITRYGTNKNASAFREVQAVRAISRYLTRNSSYAMNVINLYRDGVLTRTAERPQYAEVVPDDIQDRIAEAWMDWWSSSAPFVDSNQSAVEVERELLGSVVEDGDVVVRFCGEMRQSNDGFPCMLHYTADQFFEYNAGAKHNKLTASFMGVIIDATGRPIGYDLLSREQVSNFVFNGGQSIQHTEYPAHECLHLKLSTTAHELRGLPLITNAIYSMTGIRQFDRNAGAAMTHAAKLLGVITTTPEADSSFEAREDSGVADEVGESSYGRNDGAGIGIPDESPDTQTYRERRETQKMAEYLDVNSIIQLKNGQDMRLTTPDMPTTAVQDYRDKLIAELSAATGFSITAIKKDFTKANFAGSRLGLMSDTEMHKRHHAWWCATFRLPIYRRWLWQYLRQQNMLMLDEAVMRAVRNPRWSPPRVPYVDPRNEMLANKIGIETGILSPRAVVEGNGDDYDRTIDDLKIHQGHLKEADMPLGANGAGDKVDDGDAKQPQDEAGETDAGGDDL